MKPIDILKISIKSSNTGVLYFEGLFDSEPSFTDLAKIVQEDDEQYVKAGELHRKIALLAIDKFAQGTFFQHIVTKGNGDFYSIKCLQDTITTPQNKTIRVDVIFSKMRMFSDWFAKATQQ